jgi:integral membrane sensor domain MASE1
VKNLLISGAIFGAIWGALHYPYPIRSLTDVAVILLVAIPLGAAIGAVGPAVLVGLRYLRKRDLVTGLKLPRSE